MDDTMNPAKILWKDKGDGRLHGPFATVAAAIADAKLQWLISGRDFEAAFFNTRPAKIGGGYIPKLLVHTQKFT